MNNPAEFVDQSLAGIVAANPEGLVLCDSSCRWGLDCRRDGGGVQKGS